MEQPIIAPTTNENVVIDDEQEIIFHNDDDDDDDSSVESIPIAPSSKNKTPKQQLQSPQQQQQRQMITNRIDTFHPLIDTMDIAQATERLESFLSNDHTNSNDDHDHITTNTNKRDPTLRSFTVSPPPLSTTNQLLHQIINNSITSTNSCNTTAINTSKSTLLSPIPTSVSQRNNLNYNNYIVDVNNFDPYSPNQQHYHPTQQQVVVVESLLDHDHDDNDDDNNNNNGDDIGIEVVEATRSNSAQIISPQQLSNIPPMPNLSNSLIQQKFPGTIGFLEMEEEPIPDSVVHQQQPVDSHQLIPTTTTTVTRSSLTSSSSSSMYDPIQTSSGLLLTHRRVPPPTTVPTSATTTPNNNTTHSSSSSSSHNQLELDGYGTTSSSKYPRMKPIFSPSSSLLPSYAPNYPFFLQGGGGNNNNNGWFKNMLSPPSLPLPPIVRYVRLWIILSAITIISGTCVLLHHIVHTKGLNPTNLPGILTDDSNNNLVIDYDEQSGIFHLHGDETIHLIPISNTKSIAERSYQNFDNYNNGALTTTGNVEQIVLLPLPQGNNKKNNNKSRRLEQNFPRQTMMAVPAFHQTDKTEKNAHHSFRRQSSPLFERTMQTLHKLRSEFDEWKIRHNKSYTTEREQEHRFRIWAANHERITEKNDRHGPCTLTGQKVFGSNHLQDLEADEFQSQYLNGYHLKRHPIQKTSNTELLEHPVLGIHMTDTPQYHPSVHTRLMQQYRTEKSMAVDNNEKVSYATSCKWYDMNCQDAMGIDYQGGCKWYDISCLLRYIFSTFLFGLGGTMEPAYDANSYPSAIDWRSLGAVTEIHSQSSCGACWAITAVETVESVYFISTGKLYDLAETEVIVCETNGEMCAGGWPQDAFDYVINHNGLPLESDMPYNADFLVLVSDQIAGNSDQLDEETVATYRQETCPSGNGNDKHSGDSASVSGANTFTRYGKIKGYGYSTSKCVCYTDGSGCDCDHQNEGYAVRNLATYGPAVVCLDASTWQDYIGGIITSESGCSQGFMDVNHCVQAVGYAYISEEEYDTEKNENKSGDKNNNKNSHSGSGSRDSSKRRGYWIVRNQWSTYWGMNGYAYVAMGENTCGILNDMMQAYT